MRSLGYQRTISIENFRNPNFSLVAEILYWFIQRFDPKADIPDDIQDDKDRVEFMCAVGRFFYSNLKIQLNLKKLYTANNSCLPELLKIAEIFYNAKNTIVNSNDIDFTGELDISSKNKEIKELRELSSSIVDTGIGLLDLLEKEKVLKSQREKALEFLDNLTRGGDSVKEKEQIKNRVVSILDNQDKTLEQLDTHISQLKQKESQLDEEIKLKSIESERAEKRLEGLKESGKQKESQLDEEIKLKSIESERAEKRLEGLIGVRPKVDSEQIQLESELQHIYRIYVEKVRNHDYMEQKLEEFNMIQSLKERIDLSEMEKIKHLNQEAKKQLIFGDNERMTNDDELDGEGNYDYKKVELNNRMKNNNREQSNNTRTNNRGAKQDQLNDEDDDAFGEEEEEGDADDDEDDDAFG
eukprot:CAMPEP_0170536620 /NCGR_PEP_ID=MMETSP0209-20121228/102249_1 /TAXON_ID=665100 ORGANISM="Litonotus pictus, Strain P1" /NCGR_SAMPLE_ID=MMETSP0209 /ASSEMBLY_ACC=CAM_ASM_000301 /LENGTH=411 /DNA_ID=CAMNT_0010837999 /DNA_START=42 /DNA_END=1275 /DNA_ORIENTATION=+